MRISIEQRQDWSGEGLKLAGRKECQMSAEDDPRRPLDGIFEGLAESVAHEDSEELLEEARIAGQNPESIAQRLKIIAFAALKKFEQRKLEAAREAYQLRATNGPENKESVASTPDERKRQL